MINKLAAEDGINLELDDSKSSVSLTPIPRFEAASAVRTEEELERRVAALERNLQSLSRFVVALRDATARNFENHNGRIVELEDDSTSIASASISRVDGNNVNNPNFPSPPTDLPRVYEIPISVGRQIVSISIDPPIEIGRGDAHAIYEMYLPTDPNNDSLVDRTGWEQGRARLIFVQKDSLLVRHNISILFRVD